MFQTLRLVETELNHGRCAQTLEISGLETACEAFGAVAGRIRQAIQGSNSKAEALRLGALLSLWGNRMDLSLWPASASDGGKDTR